MTEFSARGAEVVAGSVIDYCDPDGVAPFVVIQYVRGISLAAIVRRCGALSLLRSSNIACQILAALETTRVGDITSTDILVEPHRDGSETVRIRATAPEASHASNIYAVGAILYEMITGTTPLRHTWPSQRRPDRFIPRGLEQVVMTALAHDPARRFSSASAFAAALVAATPIVERSSHAWSRCWSSTSSTETLRCAV